MPVVELRPPPILADATYRDYKSWLQEHFHDQLCSYCLVHSRSLQVDHYEPRNFRPERIHDPLNLLLSCPNSGGPAGKWDYHPAYAGRRKWRNDRTGYLVLDVRADDLAKLYDIGPKGELMARPGEHQDRAHWNVALLQLDLYANERRHCVEALALAEFAISDAEVTDVLKDYAVRAVASRASFFEIFGLELSAHLQDLVSRVRDRERV
jgi:hypothetical protein